MAALSFTRGNLSPLPGLIRRDAEPKDPSGMVFQKPFEKKLRGSLQLRIRGMRVRPAIQIRSFFWPAILAAVVSLGRVSPRQAALGQAARGQTAATKPAPPVVDPLHAEAFIQQ